MREKSGSLITCFYVGEAEFVNQVTFWNSTQNIIAFCSKWLCGYRPGDLFIIEMIKNNVHLWRQLDGLYIQQVSSAGMAAGSLVAHQTTSIHQHKSAQRGANCIRRPSLFLRGQSACVWGRVCQRRGKRRGLARSVGCLRTRGGRGWRCVVGTGQAL